MNNTEWKEKKDFMEELKRQWRLLWMERIDDKTKAEGIANQDFSLLFVERGTVITATRDFKLLDFKQVLHQHQLVQFEGVIFTSPEVGGWGKFARETYGKKSRDKPRQSLAKSSCSNGSLKKGGRGWLHAKL